MMQQPFADDDVIVRLHGFLDSRELVVASAEPFGMGAVAWSQYGESWIPISKGVALDYLARRLAQLTDDIIEKVGAQG